PAVAATYAAIADALENDPHDLDAARVAFEAKTIPNDARAWMTKLAHHADASVRAAEEWRSANDRVLVGRKLVAAAAHRIATSTSFPSATSMQDEAFHFRASLFGHLVAERAPIVDALRDRALRLLVARTIDSEPHPLAFVETMFRANGLGR